MTSTWRCPDCGMTGTAGTPQQAARAGIAHWYGPCTHGQDTAPHGQPLEPRPPWTPPEEPPWTNQL